MLSEGGGASHIRRFDSRFLLPRLPSTAVLVGALAGWRDALLAAGVEPVAPERARPEDTVFALNRDADAALALGAAQVVLLDSGAGRRRVVAVPDLHSPRVLAPTGHRAAARYAVGTWTVARNRAGRVRQATAALSVGAGFAPPRLPTLRLAGRAAGPPAVVVAAASAAGVPPGGGWFYTAEGGAASKRSSFFLFAPGAGRPTAVAKFARLPGRLPSFGREERGLAAAATAGAAVAERAPRALGCTDVGPHHVCVQSAVPGANLELILRGPAPRARKVGLLEALAEWLVDVASETSGPANRAGDERGRLRRQLAAVLPAEAFGVLDRVPTVFQHGDLAGGNILVDGDAFMLVDWEWATEHGQPLWDLLHFALHALPLLDGADWTAPSLRALFDGSAASSGLLFGWIRRMAKALALSEADVGGLALLCWARHAAVTSQVRAEAGAGAGAGAASRLGTLPVETALELWRSDPDFGSGWTRWA
ncbi:MAG TPA: phosphotransferase [Mycobacteriales bacterium]|nr:phosphotransferase [Mycobacteriales bacterium]